MSEELTKKYTDLLSGQDVLTVKNIMRVNHKPHPYVVGSRHVKHASENHSGILGEETLKAIPCAHPHCQLTYKEHTSDHVMFLQLTRNATNDELSAILQPLGKGMEEDGIDGLAFVETEEEFRIT